MIVQVWGEYLTWKPSIDFDLHFLYNHFSYVTKLIWMYAKTVDFCCIASYVTKLIRMYAKTVDFSCIASYVTNLILMYAKTVDFCCIAHLSESLEIKKNIIFSC